MKWLCLAVALVSLAGCSGSGSKALREPTQEEVASAADVAKAQNEFAFELKDAMIPAADDKNFCFSPLSLDQAFCLLLNATSGTSRDVITKALGVGGLSLNELNSGNFGLLAQMTSKDFSCANSIWTARGVTPESDFEKILKDNYNAEFRDGGAFDAATVREVNEWAEDHTRGMVPKALDEFPHGTVLALVNAIAFEGTWADKFRVEDTRDHFFNLVNGTAIQVPMMEEETGNYYARVDGAKILEKSYLESPITFLAILPPAGKTATEYLRQMDAKDLKRLMDSLQYTEVHVRLPKFKMSYGGDVSNEIQKTALAPLFHGIDLSAASKELGGADLSLTQVVHKCFIQVDEEGTRAAAVTEAGTAGSTGGGPDEKAEFFADRPFIFALVHRETQTLIMVGVVSDPRG